MNAPFCKYGLFGDDFSLIVAFLGGIGFGLPCGRMVFWVVFMALEAFVFAEWSEKKFASWRPE